MTAVLPKTLNDVVAVVRWNSRRLDEAACACEAHAGLSETAYGAALAVDLRKTISALESLVTDAEAL